MFEHIKASVAFAAHLAGIMPDVGPDDKKFYLPVVKNPNSGR